MAVMLLIDDDADLRDFLQGELEGQGHAVHCLERAEQGPEVLSGAPFDLVLLDNKMPGMSGIEFLEALKERGLDAPVILMTGDSSQSLMRQAIQAHVYSVIPKPVSKNVVLYTVVRALVRVYGTLLRENDRPQ